MSSEDKQDLIMNLPIPVHMSPEDIKPAPGSALSIYACSEGEEVNVCQEIDNPIGEILLRIVNYIPPQLVTNFQQFALTLCDPVKDRILQEIEHHEQTMFLQEIEHHEQTIEEKFQNALKFNLEDAIKLIPQFGDNAVEHAWKVANLWRESSERSCETIARLWVNMPSDVICYIAKKILQNNARSVGARVILARHSEDRIAANLLTEALECLEALHNSDESDAA